MPYYPPASAGGGINATIGGNSTSAGAGYALISSGTMVLAGAANITLSQDGQNISISGGAGAGGGIAADIGGNSTSAGAGYVTITSGTMLLAGGNNVTLSQNGQNITISAAAQSVQVVQSAIQGSDATYTSGKVIFTGVGGGITVSSNTGQRVDLSVAAPVAQTAQTQSNLQAVVPLGNTTGTTGSIQTGTFGLAGGNNITISQSSGTASTNLTISAANQTVQTQNNVDLSFSTTAGGGTAGTMALISSGTMTMFAGNNITISQSGTNTVVISALASSSLSASANITISSNGSTISFSVAPANSYKLPEWQNMPALNAQNLSNLTAFSKTPFYWPEVIHGAMTPSSIAFKLSAVNTSTNVSFSAHLGIYTYVNSTSAALLGSASDAFVVSSNSSASFSGVRHWIMTSPGTVAAISNLTPGPYLFGAMFSMAATSSGNFSIQGASVAAGDVIGWAGPGTNIVSTGTSQGVHGLMGLGSSTVNVMPANVSRADLVNQGTGVSAPLHPYVYIRS